MALFPKLQMEEYLGVGFLYCDIIIFDEKGLATG